MKKLLIATLLLLELTVPIHAQEGEATPGEQVEIETQEENVSQEEIEEEDSTNLSEELKITQEDSIWFWSILFATITPALLILIAYLLIKMANK